MRKRAMKESKEIQSGIVEPVELSEIKSKTEIKEITPTVKPQEMSYEEIVWNRIFLVLGIIALLIIAFGFIYGVLNDKFKSNSNVETNFPEINIPDCPVCSCPNNTLVCQEVVCPNVSCSCPDINVFYNMTK